MAAKKNEKVVVKSRIADNQMEPAELLGARGIAATGNIVLIFQNSEVIMPGAWRLHRDLCVGDRVSAYWDDDRRFHLTWEDEA